MDTFLHTFYHTSLYNNVPLIRVSVSGEGQGCDLRPVSTDSHRLSQPARFLIRYPLGSLLLTS